MVPLGLTVFNSIKHNGNRKYIFFQFNEALQITLMIKYARPKGNHSDVPKLLLYPG